MIRAKAESQQSPDRQQHQRGDKREYPTAGAVDQVAETRVVKPYPRLQSRSSSCRWRSRRSAARYPWGWTRSGRRSAPEKERERKADSGHVQFVNQNHREEKNKGARGIRRRSRSGARSTRLPVLRSKASVATPPSVSPITPARNPPWKTMPRIADSADSFRKRTRGSSSETATASIRSRNRRWSPEACAGPA